MQTINEFPTRQSASSYSRVGESARVVVAVCFPMSARCCLLFAGGSSEQNHQFEWFVLRFARSFPQAVIDNVASAEFRLFGAARDLTK